MFSRWDFLRSTAIKRVCKFLLKKKLGEFILGDIDLDQLDVQLRDGTIHLSDLALNVDFLNQKLAGAAVLVKEGSIKSLSIKIPWKRKNCQIEVEVLELVLAPSVQGSTSVMDANPLMPNCDKEQQMCIDSEKIELGDVKENSGAISRDVHEGVKTIAKIVKWFLTSFHVRINEIFVAYDPHANVEERRSEFLKSLVLRIKEIEFGTCVCEDAMAKLTNFVKFQEAVIEFLQLEDVENSPQLHNGSETGFNETYAGKSTITILTGPSGGFSGMLNLSIPWENGSLDIRKVDADVSVDSVELKVQPSSINWLIAMWESLKNVSTAQQSNIYKAADSPDCKCRSTSGSAIPDSDKVTPGSGSYSNDIFLPINQDSSSDALLTRTHLIHNWVPESIDLEDRTDLEPDYDASIDEFFECFDGMRTYQANSGTSGIWNWTCSVFSAITVASNLASGSGHVPTEQNLETSLRATIAEISVVLSFIDEDQTQSYDSSNILNSLLNGQSSDSYMSCHSTTNIEESTFSEVNSMKIHHLEASCQHLTLDLQTYPQIMKFGASLKRIKVNEYYDSRSRAEGFNFPDYKNDSYYQMLLNQHLQAQVQGSLPPYPFFTQDHDSESSVANCRNGLIKVTLLESLDICSFRYSVSSTGIDGKQIASTSFSVHLPPFVLWVHFPLVNMLLNLFKQVEYSFKKGSMNKDFVTNVLSERHNSSSLGDAESGNISYLTTLSPRASLQGNIVLSQARVIVCFPSEYYGDFRHSASLDKFIVLEHSSSVGDVVDFLQLPKESSPNDAYCTPSTSVHLHMGNFDIYFVKSSSENSLVDGSHALDKQPFSAVKILSVTNRSNGYHSGISMLWQKGPVTGPWMASRTWSLSKLHDQSKNKVVREGAEYSSVATEDLDGTSSSIRQELILSSAFLFHVKFYCVCINLHSHDYKLLNQLLNYLLDELSSEAHGTDTNYEGIRNEQPSPNVCFASQTSVHVECDLLDICITLDEVIEVSHLIQKELQGSWNCLKLKVKKFELLSASNIGGNSKANFSWLNHGEGELWGSILNRNEKASEVTEDLLLITCKNSAIRRGDGDGTNALSFISAGTTVTHIWNPESCQSYTSIIVRGGTVVAPGGRLDWIGAICLYFSLPSQENVQSGNGKDSVNGAATETLFFLDLVDTALSYEPYIKDPIIANGVSEREHSCSTESNEEGEREYVACLLAAASLSLSNCTKADSSTVNYNIQLQDAGLLICESTGTRNGSDGYHVGCLQEISYVKVSQIALVEAILRIKGLLWEIECSESHISLDTCHDTTYGLVHLVAQLQQLYAPDVEDALMHLQSRWNTIQQAQEDCSSNDVADTESTSVGLGLEKSSPASGEDCVSVGLLDEILENAFYINGEYRSPSGHWDIQSHVSLDEYVLGDRFKLNINNTTASNASALIIPKDGSSYGSGTGTGKTQQPSMHKQGSPQLIESYYASDLLQPSTLTAGRHSPKEDHKCRLDNTTRWDMECGKGGWYKDSSLMIVENHISKIFSQPEGKQHKEGNFTSSNSGPAENYIPKGRILVKNIDVKWRMYSGLDWIKPSKNPYNSLKGRDGSVCLQFTLSGLNLQYDMYPDGEICVSKLSVSAQDFHLYDMSRDAPWKMVLGYYHSKDHPRESCAKAFKLHLEAVRPDPSTPLEDYRLHLEFLPMRLHLDQDQLNFLISFFGNDSFVDEPPRLPNNLSESVTSGRKSRSFGSQTIMEEALLPFFQKCVVRPLVVRVDYIPRHFDPAALRRGNYAELLNLVAWKALLLSYVIYVKSKHAKIIKESNSDPLLHPPRPDCIRHDGYVVYLLQGIDLHLKHVCALGVYGWNSICETVLGEWLEDISHNQVHKLLKGLAPIRSLFAVSSGTSKLVSFPVKSYRKDHKLLKGIQRGAIAFIRSISIEAVGLGVHLAAGAHEILLQTEYILTSIPSSGSLSEMNRRKSNIRSNQPEDAQQGIRQAYESLSDGFTRTASALLKTPLKAYQRGAGAGSALATAFRAAPAAAVAPVSASARAVHCTLLGLRNSLDPEHKKESMGKYLGSS